MISSEDAQYLLIDLAIKTHFKDYDGSYIFNDSIFFGYIPR